MHMRDVGGRAIDFAASSRYITIALVRNDLVSLVSLGLLAVAIYMKKV